jgi:hypothetical protein
MHGDGGSLTRTSSERLTSLLTVAGDLPKRRSAQRGAGPYSHGGVLTRRRRALRFEDVQQRRAHYFAVYGCQRPAETLICTAVSARFMVRMGSPVRFRRGAPARLLTSGNAGQRFIL